MTKPSSKPDRAAPETEIEITPEMIEAGCAAYGAHFLDLMRGEDFAPSAMVKEVFRAMDRFRPK
jgi:hypothetical protein